MHCHTSQELERFRDLNCKAVTVIGTAGAQLPSDTWQSGDPVEMILKRRR